MALPVAIAETVDHKDDQTAIVRLRDNGRAQLSVTFYRVDDLDGTIGGLAPGEAGLRRAGGGTCLRDRRWWHLDRQPVEGQLAEATLVHVDAGDLVAMSSTTCPATISSGHSPGQRGGRRPKCRHLWNYGLNTGPGRKAGAAEIATTTDLTGSSTSRAPTANGYLATVGSNKRMKRLGSPGRLTRGSNHTTLRLLPPNMIGRTDA